VRRLPGVHEQFGQGVVALHQPVAPALQLVRVGDVLVRTAFPHVQFGEYRRWIDRDASACRCTGSGGVAPNELMFFIGAYRVAQILRDVELRELVLAQFRQFLARSRSSCICFLILSCWRQFLLVFFGYRLVTQAAPTRAGLRRMGADDFDAVVVMLVFIIRVVIVSVWGVQRASSS